MELFYGAFARKSRNTNFYTPDNKSSQGTIYTHLPQHANNPTTHNRFLSTQNPRNRPAMIVNEIQLRQKQKPETTANKY